MTIDDLLVILQKSPLVASVQTNPGSAVDDVETLLKLARASLSEGVRILRMEGASTVARAKAELGVPIIGLIKRQCEGSEVYITPTLREVEALIATGCDVISIDGTERPRPGDATLKQLVKAVRGPGRIVMADCDSLESARYASECGADIVGTTLSGYTGGRTDAPEPDIWLIRAIASELDVPVLAEGRYTEPWQVRAAMQAGATGVVIGGAINDPVKQTRRFVSAAMSPAKPVGAFDIGGSWLRFGLFSPGWELLDSTRVPLPPTMSERIAWMRDLVATHSLESVGVGSGGTVDPVEQAVWESSDLIPDNVGTNFRVLAPSVAALNDGLATAWGHSCLPEYSGRRVATLALGTGVGCGLVDRGRIWMGRQGEYPRLSDLATESGQSFEELLGGAQLGTKPSHAAHAKANEALHSALDTLVHLYMPEVIVLCGGVGLADWLDFRSAVASMKASGVELVRSPFGADAGLYGAAALALLPPGP